LKTIEALKTIIDLALDMHHAFIIFEGFILYLHLVDQILFNTQRASSVHSSYMLQSNVGFLCKLILQPSQYENPSWQSAQSMKCVYFYYTERALFDASIIPMPGQKLVIKRTLGVLVIINISTLVRE